MITVATLIAAGINPTQARLFAEPLAEVCAFYDIDTPLRVAHFVGQCAHESGGFARLEESLWYSRPEGIRANWPARVINLTMAQGLVGKPQALANVVYANRYGNGDTLSGDGWKYRGRGLIQLTFRDNYARCGTDCGLPYAEQPELVALPGDACITAGWYWKDKHINSLADTGSVESVTRAINSKLLGIDDRKRRTAMALEAFS